MVRISIQNLLVLCFVIPTSQALSLETKPTPEMIYDGTTSNFKVRCQFLGISSDETVQKIKLDFKKTSSNTKELAQVTGTTATITDPTLTSRATVTGEIFDSGSSSYLDLSFGNVSCAEVGTYTCTAEYRNSSSGGSGSTQSQTAVEGRSYPMELEVKHDPVKDKYAIGEQVTITCSGKVGKPSQTWRWQEYDEVNKVYKTVTNGVTNDPASLVTDCSYYAVTNLRYLIEDDKKHTFRCVVGLNVDTSVTTEINGDVSGASFLLLSPILLICSVFLNML